MAEENKPKAPAATTPAELEKYRVHSPYEVQRILRDLARSTQLITAYFNSGREFILTTLLHADPDNNRLILDYGPDEALNQRLLANQHAIFVTRHNQVRVQFGTEQIQKATYQGAPALVVPWPASVVRLQRREFYRLATPTIQRLNLSFTSPYGTVVNAYIVDISVGGVGLIEPPAEAELSCEAGTVINHCRIELPEEGVIEAAIEIRNRYQVDSKDGHPVYRVGCRLLNLDTRQSAAIQRYIQRIELERRRVKND